MVTELKQVIIVRKDLDLSKGKLCTQVAHAAVSAFLATKKQYPKWAKEWLKEGQKKIVLKVSSIDELLSIFNKLTEAKIPTVLIRDAGLTQLPPDTITCIGAGPVPAPIIDRITGHLKLL